MAKLLNLSRAARLVGVTRGALQKKIHDGELASFDGMITLDELQRVFPGTSLATGSAYEHVENIKDKAFGRRVAERALPDKEVLAARVQELGKELAQSKSQAKHSAELLDGLAHLLGEWSHDGGARSEFADTLREWLREKSLQAPVAGNFAQSLIVRDSFLRVMAAQVKLLPSGEDFFVEGGDTILEAALRMGLPLPYACSGGSCGACRARVVQGEVKQVRPYEYVLTPALRDQGYCLTCSYTAVSDLVLQTDIAHTPADIPEQQVGAQLRAMDRPTDEAAVLHLKTPPDRRLRFIAGQHARVQLGGSLSMTLPIASCPCEDRHIEFHVRRLPGHPFSDYVFNELRVGDPVGVTGPQGDFVLDTTSARPLVFIGFCTGFAPIKSLMEHAMALDQAESIHLFWVATKQSGLYLEGLARAWADALDNFHYTPIVAGGDLDATASRQEHVVNSLIGPKLAALPTLARSNVYVAGPSLVVDHMRRLLLSLRVPEAQIHADFES